MSYKFFQLENEGNVTTVTINRPPSNAMSVEFIDELVAMLDDLAADSSTRAVLFRSALPKYFMTGADLKTIPPTVDLSDIDPDLPPVEAMRQIVPRLADYAGGIFSAAQGAMNAIEALPKPTVVLIGGHALGGGLEFCLACDFRIMAKGPATIGLTEVNLGLLPVAGGTQRLRRLLGRGKALEMIILGQRLDAEAAQNIGLITKAVEADRLEEEGKDFAADLASRATLSIAKAKECVLGGEDLQMENGLALERDAIVELMHSGDMVEGILSFVLGKKPEFQGS